MRFCAPLMLVAALAFCGGGSSTGYSGTFAGTLETVNDCGDAGTNSVPADVTWQLQDNGATISIDPDGTCGDFTAAAHQYSATIEQQSCPGTSASLSGGTLILYGDKLSVQMSFGFNLYVPIPGADGGTLQYACGASVSGMLERQ